MSIRIIQGDCREVLRTLPDASAHCCVTSPPYFGLRDYGMPEQIGLEPTPAEFVAQLVEVFREVRRVLRDDGTLWLNLGGSYYNTNPGSGGKCVLPGAGKAMTQGRYHDAKRDFSGSGLKPKDLIGEAHFATMAPELAETCIKAGCPDGGTVLDPFGGAGTTGLVADQLQRRAVLCELNPEYIGIARRRIAGDAPLFAEIDA